MKTLVPIHIIPVAVRFGWLVTSLDERWKHHYSEHFTPKEGKARALSYAKERALQFAKRGLEGGTVKIHGRDGRIKEERTYPRSRDPRRSKG